MRFFRKKSVLFVCRTNICRSPTAEAVFRKRAQEAGLADTLRIDSAATHGYHVGAPPDIRSQESAAKRGYDLSKQRARKLRASDFSRFDYLLAMDWDNLAFLEETCPRSSFHKVGLLMQFSTRYESDIVPDPYLDGGAGFDLVLDYIEDAAEGLIEVFRK